jgi:hypothetical protein
MKSFVARLAAVMVAATLAACGGGGGGGSDNTEAQLTVTVIGPTTPAPTAQGRVTSQPAGIDCGSSCNATFAIDTVVTLAAAAPAGQQFSAWSGACSGASATCAVTMSQARAVTATFAPASGGTVVALSVAVTGGGTVSSQPGGINCGSTCSANFAADTAVTLTAAPASGQVFSSWGGACSGGAATCNVTLSAARSVTAAFATAPVTAGWSDAAVLSADGTDQPRVVIDAAGNATVLWLQLEPSGVFRRSVWASRRPVGGNWSAASRLELSEQDIGEAALAVGAVSGRAMAIWRELSSTGPQVFARAADVTGLWGAMTRINGAGNNVGSLRLGMDGSGNAVALWSQTATGSTVTSVWSNRYNVSTGWGSAVRVDSDATASTQDLDPSLAVSGNGQAFAAWSRLGSGIWASRADAGGNWSTPTQLAQGLVSVGVGLPRVAADASGNAMAVWAQGATTNGQFTTQLVSKRFAGSGWSGTAAPLYAPVVTTVLSEVRLAVNGPGQFAAVWTQAEASVRAVRSDAAGTWGAAATVRPAGAELRSLPDIGIDSLGNQFATWAARNPTTGSDEVWLNRFAPASGWASATVHQPTADPTGSPRMAMNDRGHAVMAWVRNGSDGSRVISRNFASGR